MIARIGQDTSLHIKIYQTDLSQLRNEGLEAITSPASIWRMRMKVFVKGDCPQFDLKLITSQGFPNLGEKYLVEEIPREGKRFIQGGIVYLQKEFFDKEVSLRESGQVQEPGLFEHLRGISFNAPFDRIWVNYENISGITIAKVKNPLVYDPLARKNFAPLWYPEERPTSAL